MQYAILLLYDGALSADSMAMMGALNKESHTWTSPPQDPHVHALYYALITLLCFDHCPLLCFDHFVLL